MGNEIRPKEIQKAAGKSGGNSTGGSDQQTGAAFHEAGALYTGKCRALRSGGAVLYTFYVSDPAVSGSSDPQDH